MPFQIIRNDITRVSADAIVNTANPEPIIGGGTDSAIYRAAGEDRLLAERERIGRIARGDAVATPAFDLDARYIIHTVGPVWVDGSHGEQKVLRACYANSLKLAASLGCKRIAFPLISSGVYGFPKDEALSIALSEIQGFLFTHDMEVLLVVFDRRALELSGKLIGAIEEYIDDHAVGRLQDEEYDQPRLSRDRRMDAQRRHAEMVQQSRSSELMFDDSEAPFVAPFPDLSGKELGEVLDSNEDTFQQRLFKLIDERGLDDVTVYKKANIDRKVFSRIRCRQDYRPTKKTAVAFSIALELDMPTMLDLLSRAEIAFSPSNRFDLIISYFVTHRKYDIFEINAVLFEYGQPTLGYME